MGEVTVQVSRKSWFAEENHAFDGIVCMGGEDWWYHNRGHFDFQILRRIAQDIPVLYVNSIGVRFPSVRASGQFGAKISRKLKSVARGLTRVENQFFVVSALMAPGRLGQMLTGWALTPQVKLAARRAGILRPLLWIHCPAGVQVLDGFTGAPVVMQRTDRFEAFPEAAGGKVAADIAELKARADLAIYCNTELMHEERGQVAAQVMVSHGVDVERFVDAGKGQGGVPDDVRDLPGPRVGFVGGIDRHTFDPELFAEVAGALPDVQFFMVGGCSIGGDWCPGDNVRFLGRKPYDEVADYMAAADVLIMPWNNSAWIQACNPIKLKEYLAVGRPIVSTDFSALDPYRDLVRVACGPEAFAAHIREALKTPFDAEAARARVAGESWDAKAEDVRRALAGLSVSVPAPAELDDALAA